ncbi:MAG: hypothetical protein IT355_06345 [Gemmatimonadaceae bacterium]|nr:hypothetical protein [Gemmatimonadaceae bacterium]
MNVDPAVLDRIFDRLVRTLSAGGPDQLRAPFTIADIVQAFVPYRTYRHELGVDTLQDYEHAVLELLGGERPMLECDPDTVAAIRKELASPDPDTALLRRLQSVQVRMGAIRMPVVADPAPSSPRAETPLPLIAVTEADQDSLRDMVSDAVAFGGAIDRGEYVPVPESDLGSAALPAVEVVTSADGATDAAAGTAPPAPDLADGSAERGVVAAEADSAQADGAETLPAAAAVATPAAVVVTEPVTEPVTAPALPSLAGLRQLIAEPAPVTALQAVHGVTIASAQTVSRITPLTMPSVYGDPIDFRGVRHAPVDAGGVIFLFGMIARELGFHVEAMTSGFPRCEAKRQLAPGRWARVRIDFELESRQFRDAGRNPSSCDVVVCWRDTWPDRPATLEVLALERIISTLPARE